MAGAVRMVNTMPNSVCASAYNCLYTGCPSYDPGNRRGASRTATSCAPSEAEESELPLHTVFVQLKFSLGENHESSQQIHKRQSGGRRVRVGAFDARARAGQGWRHQ